MKIDKILTVFLDNYDDFKLVAQSTGLDVSYKNKIGIDFDTLEELLDIQKLLEKLGYNLTDIKQAFNTNNLDYINFEYWN